VSLQLESVQSHTWLLIQYAICHETFPLAAAAAAVVTKQQSHRRPYLKDLLCLPQTDAQDIYETIQQASHRWWIVAMRGPVLTAALATDSVWERGENKSRSTSSVRGPRGSYLTHHISPGRKQTLQDCAYTDIYCLLLLLTQPLRMTQSLSQLVKYKPARPVRIAPLIHLH